ncbi:PspA/IM30 family protein [Microbulbifer sp. SSSA007]|uniref:PspA/IM30 family protein n=1 Tax=Microbulbifer TaxID=48073 RepID=UPI0003808AD8|nr:PspA/IM30 family protein [Microbulbifer variabilis]
MSEFEGLGLALLEIEIVKGKMILREGLIKRISRLISVSANSVVGSVEAAAPESVMEQAIRDVDDAIKDVRGQLGKAEASKYLNSRTLNDENTRHKNLAEQITIAINEGRDDLAEAAIAKQMDIEVQLPILEKAISENEIEIKELGSYILALQGKKREMREKLQEFIAVNKNVRGSVVADEYGRDRNSKAQVEQATDAFNRAIDSTAISTFDSEIDASKLAELEEFARKNRVKERLAKIKSGG